jgi:hypothetical protein
MGTSNNQSFTRYSQACKDSPKLPAKKNDASAAVQAAFNVDYSVRSLASSGLILAEPLLFFIVVLEKDGFNATELSAYCSKRCLFSSCWPMALSRPS